MRLAKFAAAIVFVLIACPAAFGQAAPEARQDYVGSQACAQCHEKPYSAWRRSHHANAWNAPDEKTVLGDFSGAIFTHNGVETRFTRKGGDFFIATQGADGKTHEYKVRYTAGVTPLQQYLIETDPGRLQAFDVAWDTIDKRWYPLFPEQKISAADGLHWTGPYKNWNGRCAECHATDYRKNYDPRTRRYHSVQSETGVGCEACHGAGARHVDWARSRGAGKKLDDKGQDDKGQDDKGQDDKGQDDRGQGDKGLDIAFAGRPAAVETQQCAGCHSRRETLTDSTPPAGTKFADAYSIALLRPGLYYPDGAIKDEVYVYGSFLQSKMSRKGVRCSNCHEPHSGQLRAEGNALCTQCHSPAGNPNFSSLAKKNYDTPEHHFHATGSKGAECKSCHMMARVYMGVDKRRDHSFRVPRPDLSAAIGVPDTCNDCHKDKTAAWAQDELKKRFPHSLHRGGHFATVFAQANVNPLHQADALLAIAADAGQAGIVRATALDLLRPAADPKIAARAQPLLRDGDPIVRAAAAMLQRGIPAPERVLVLAPVLSDTVKSVRIAAAKELIGAVGPGVEAGVVAEYRKANAEFMAAFQARSDFPETHMALGGIALGVRNMRAAYAAFSEAVEEDPQLVQGWTMLVQINLARGQKSAAQRVLQQAQAANPDDQTLKEMETVVKDLPQ
ncbi:MAG: multiheme c-type cytochrome [Rhodoblastus sp.]